MFLWVVWYNFSFGRGLCIMTVCITTLWRLSILYILGPVKDLFADCINPVDYFLKYFDGAILDSIVCQSNLYINQCEQRVSVITKPELYSFFGINLFYGYHELPSWKNYWNSEPNFSVPFISNALPRNRFLQILSNIRVNDNKSVPINYDPL